MSPKILIAAADPIERELAAETVRRFNYAVEAVADGAAALARLAEGAGPVDLLLADLALPGPGGFGLLEQLKAKPFAPPLIALIAREAPSLAGAALQAGALDFLMKPPSPERLKASIANALRMRTLEAELRRVSHGSGGLLHPQGAARLSPEMERAVKLAERAAKSPLPALIEGEAGAGKETLARAIHFASERRARPFVSLRCAGFSAAAIDALLFGEDGASGRRLGRIAEAQGGTLYIGEVSELGFEAQRRLLGLISAGEIDDGSARPQKADVRIIASTRRDLIELVKARRFREDLYYRLSAYPIGAPPLRRRQSEIEELAQGFCLRFSAEQGRFLRGLCAEALALLCAHDWPGNVRELEAAVYRAVALAQGPELTAPDFPQLLARAGGGLARIPPLSPPMPEFIAPDSFMPDLIAEAAMTSPAMPQNMLGLLGPDGDMRRLAELEAEAIGFALIHYRGAMSKMARKLGIGRSTLYRKIKDYGLGELADESAEDSSADPSPARAQGAA